MALPKELFMHRIKPIKAVKVENLGEPGSVYTCSFISGTIIMDDSGKKAVMFRTISDTGNLKAVTERCYEGSFLVEECGIVKAYPKKKFHELFRATRRKMRMAITF